MWPQKVKLVTSKSESSNFNYVKAATSIMWQEIERSAFFATLTCKSPAVTQLSSENQSLAEGSLPWTVFPWIDHRLKMSRSLSLPPSAALDVDSCSCVWFLFCRFNFFCFLSSFHWFNLKCNSWYYLCFINKIYMIGIS